MQPHDHASASLLAQLLGARLTHARQRRGWPVVELADRAGLHDAHLRDYETGVRLPSVEHLVRLARALDTTAGHLLGEDELGVDLRGLDDEDLDILRTILARLAIVHRQRHRQ